MSTRGFTLLCCRDPPRFDLHERVLVDFAKLDPGIQAPVAPAADVASGELAVEGEGEVIGISCQLSDYAICTPSHDAVPDQLPASASQRRSAFVACPLLEIPQRRARDHSLFLTLDATLAASLTPAADRENQHRRASLSCALTLRRCGRAL
jgi:hypothetical protein